MLNFLHHCTGCTFLNFKNLFLLWYKLLKQKADLREIRNAVAKCSHFLQVPPVFMVAPLYLISPEHAIYSQLLGLRSLKKQAALVKKLNRYTLNYFFPQSSNHFFFVLASTQSISFNSDLFMKIKGLVSGFFRFTLAFPERKSHIIFF